MINQTSHVIKHIESFTALRDQELLAYSLLQSICGIITPIERTLVTVSLRGTVLNQVLFSEGGYINKAEGFETTEQWTDYFDFMLQSGLDEHVFTESNGFIVMYSLKHSKVANQFLVLKLRKNLTSAQSYMLSGMLNIYNNFNTLLIDSQTDELTGLLNRKTFESSIMKLVKFDDLVEEFDGSDRRCESEDSQDSNWIALLDVDHFKTINDRFGHLYGDEVLIHLANMIKANLRAGDVVFRFGGEEFAILMRNISRQKCSVALNRLRENIAMAKFTQVDNLTVSLGATQFKENIFHTTLVDYADQALYYSKQNGRNRLTFFEELLDSGIAKEAHLQYGDIDLF